jgi:hypothetical protein
VVGEACPTLCRNDATVPKAIPSSLPQVRQFYVAEVEVNAMKNGNEVMPYIMRIGSLAKNIQEKNDVNNNYKQAAALRQVISIPLWSKTLTSPAVMRYAKGVREQYTLAMEP